MSTPDRIPSLDPLERALAELPRQRASDSFTARVVERAGTGEPERGGWPRGAVAAAAVLVLVSGATAWRLERARRLETLRGEVSELQTTHRLLAQELRELRATEKPPVVYLGGDDNVDLFLDLAELERLQKAGGRPASASTTAQPTGDTI